MEGPHPVSAEELREAWPVLSLAEQVEAFLLLPRDEADEFFLSLTPSEQANIIEGVGPRQRRLWMRLLPPDDAADVLQEVSPENKNDLLNLLNETTRREVTALLAYAEDNAGGLMSPRFARVRPDMSVDEAVRYLRRQAADKLETLYYAYVLDQQQRLLGVVSFRQLFASRPEMLIREIMEDEPVAVPEEMDQEEVAQVFAVHDLLAVPVLDDQGRMRGIVTVDDIVDVVQEEATEDMQKVGGMEALDRPYMQTPFLPMVKKRAGWLSALLLGGMLTASAMGLYEAQIAGAIELAIFLPLVISSGGNSGSQATTLVIRAMALGEVHLRDWWRIVSRELASGLTMGTILGLLGFIRIVLWQALFQAYGPGYLSLAVIVALSLMGVVTWGTIIGSMLPFVLERLRFDPASASAPFVATLVDVLGVIIYFSMADLIWKVG